MYISDFEERDTQVLGISTDPRPTQTAFAASLGSVPYPILADFHPKGNVCQLYDVYNYRRGTADRAVFVIDKAGTVRWKRVYASAKDVDLNEILAEIDRL
jgi:alkyl hydroperoxide reductase subunit AhpC